MIEFLDETWQISIALIGTAASLSSAFLAESTLRSRAIHVCYTGAIVIIIFLMTSYNSRIETELLNSSKNYSALIQEIDNLQSIKNRADGVLKSMYSGTDQGKNRGNILQAISFFETYKERYPTSLELLMKMASQVGVTEKALQSGTRGSAQQREALEQAGAAARALVQGVATGG